MQPHDEDAYGRRQQQRDADTLSAFGRVFHHADELVHVAEQQLARLASSDRTRRYAWQVREPREATQHLYAVPDEWRSVRNELLKSAWPGMKAYDEPLAEMPKPGTTSTHGPSTARFSSPSTLWQNARRSKPHPPCPPLSDLGGTAVFEYRRALPPAARLHHAFRRRTGIRPWAFPAWN